jgi:hypothetical protein
VALTLACIAYDVGVPCPTIMVQLDVPSTGGLAVIPWIIAVLTHKRVPTPRHKSIQQATWCVVPIKGTTSIPSFLLREVTAKFSPKYLWDMITLNSRCHGSAVIGIPFHLPCTRQDVPGSFQCVFVHLCGQPHHAEGMGKISKVFGLKIINMSLQCSNYINVSRVASRLQECYTSIYTIKD